MDGGAWGATVHGVTKCWAWLSDFTFTFKTGFSSMWTENFQMCKPGLEKAEEPWSNCQHSLNHKESKGISLKISTSVSLTTLKPLTVWITTDCGKFFKRWEYQTTLPVSWETCIWVKKQQLEPYMEELTGSKLGKYDKAVYHHPVYLTYMQSTSYEVPEWMNHKPESRWQEEISMISDMQMIPV